MCLPYDYEALQSDLLFGIRSLGDTNDLMSLDVEIHTRLRFRWN